MIKIPHLLCCLLLACAPALEAQQSSTGKATRTSRKKQSDFSSSLTSSLALQKRFPSAIVENSQLRFRIKGYKILVLLHPSYKKAHVIYIFPDDAAGEKNREALQVCAQELYELIAPDQSQKKIHINSKGNYAQLIIEDKINTQQYIVGLSTANAVRRLNQSLGAPYDWRGNRLIWQIIFNNRNHCLEIALDISQEELQTLDIKLLSNKGSLPMKAVYEQLKSSLGFTFREETDLKEKKTWREKTGFGLTQVQGLQKQSNWQSKITNNSIVLVKRDDYLRMAKPATLHACASDKKSWVISPDFSYPSQEEELSAPPKKQAKPVQEVKPANNPPQEGEETSTDVITVVAGSTTDENTTPAAEPAIDQKPANEQQEVSQPLSPDEALKAYIKELEMS